MAITSFNGYSFPYIQSNGTAGGSYGFVTTKSCVTGQVKIHIPTYASTTKIKISGKVISEAQLDALKTAFLNNQDVVSGSMLWSNLSIGDVKNLGNAILAEYTAEFEKVA